MLGREDGHNVTDKDRFPSRHRNSRSTSDHLAIDDVTETYCAAGVRIEAILESTAAKPVGRLLLRWQTTAAADCSGRRSAQAGAWVAAAAQAPASMPSASSWMSRL
jgi:hypothetical protein